MDGEGKYLDQGGSQRLGHGKTARVADLVMAGRAE